MANQLPPNKDIEINEFIGIIILTVFILAAIALTSRHANAGSKSMSPVQSLPIYQTECGSCHLAYPPGFLPKTSWEQLMSNLSKHYGTDASIDAKSNHQINQWLTQYGGSYKRVKESPPENRITKSAWFERKHRKVKASDFTKPSVRSPANCAACHQQAEQGLFDDDDVRIPD
jgi:cytochrome c553